MSDPTIVKLKQIARDAKRKHDELIDSIRHTPDDDPLKDQMRINRGYWAGYEDGIKRAIRVVEGKG